MSNGTSKYTFNIHDNIYGLAIGDQTSAVTGGDPLTWEINATTHVWECSIEEAEVTILRFIQRGLVEPRDDRYWMHALLADYAAEIMEERGL